MHVDGKRFEGTSLSFWLRCQVLSEAQFGSEVGRQSRIYFCRASPLGRLRLALDITPWYKALKHCKPGSVLGSSGRKS